MMNIKWQYALLLILAILFMMTSCDQTKETVNTKDEKYSVAFEERSFSSASDFDAGYALVDIDGNYFLIDTDGNTVFTFPTETVMSNNLISPFNFSYKGQGITAGLVTLGNKEPEILFDSNGNQLATSSFGDLFWSSEGFHSNLIAVNLTQDKIGSVKDIAGKTLFSGNAVYMYYGNIRFGYLDDQGKIIVPDELDFTKSGEEIYAYVKTASDGSIEDSAISNYYFCNNNGETIFRQDGTEFIKDEDSLLGSKENMLVFYDGIAAFYNKYIRLDGTMFGDKEWDELRDFSEDYAVIKIDDNYGYIDTNGEVIVQPQYKYAGDVHEGLAAVGLWDDTYQYLKLGEAGFNKSELHKKAISLETINQSSGPVPPVNDTSKADYVATDFIGKTYSEIVLMLGTNHTRPESVDGGLSINYEVFTFDFPPGSDDFFKIDPNTKMVYVETGGGYIDHKISVGMTLDEMEKIEGYPAEIYYNEELCGNEASIKLDNGYTAHLNFNESDRTVYYATINCK